jgi:cytoskeletal protein RodZ
MLRAARERRGLSLRQVSNTTKIAMMTLEALERNDIARLPGGIFSRGFVRSYALEVGLDPEIVIQAFLGQFPQDSVTAGHPTTSQVEDHEAVESDRRAASTLLRLFAISIPVAAVAVYFSTAGRRVPAVGSPQPAVGSQQSTVDSSRSAVPGPQSAAASQPLPVDGPEPAAAAPNSGIGGPPAVARTAPAPAATAAASAADGRLVVQVSASRPSWISAIVDGSRAVQREFKAGEEATFDVRKEIILTAGDAAGVSVTFNGMPAKPLGGSGQVVTVRVNPTNFRNYLVTP